MAHFTLARRQKNQPVPATRTRVAITINPVRFDDVCQRFLRALSFSVVRVVCTAPIPGCSAVSTIAGGPLRVTDSFLLESGGVERSSQC